MTRVGKSISLPLEKTYLDDIERYEEERQALLSRIRADTATPREVTRYRALTWKIEAIRQRIDKRYREGIDEPIRILK